MHILLILLQITIYDVFDYLPQDNSREVAVNAEIVQRANLSDSSLFMITSIKACDNQTFLLYDAGTKSLYMVGDDGVRRINSGSGGGPMDLNVGRGFSCSGHLIAYYDEGLKRITVYDTENETIKYQNVLEGNIDQLYLYEDDLYYFDIEFVLDQPLKWLYKVDLATGTKEVVLNVDSPELGKGIVLTGRSAGFKDTFCHITAFSGLLACFSASGSELLFGRSPIHKQGFIEAIDRSELLSRLGITGTAIGK